MMEEDGQNLLLQISNAMVRAQKEFFGKGPTKAKSYMLDDMLFVVMRGGMTQAEKTMLDFGHADQVRAFRQIFQNEMTEKLIGMIEDMTGRKVLTYQSQILFGPHMSIEMFVFEDSGGRAAILAAAEEQFDDGDGSTHAGEVTQ